MSTSSVNNTPKEFSPKTFVIWLFMVASTMLFLAFCSAYFVHQGDGLLNNAWLKFDLPFEFWISAIIVIVSSFFMQMAYRAAQRDDIYKIPSLLTITLICGIAFCISQFYGWINLMDRGLFLSNKEPAEISASFVYVISAAHFAHIIGGLVLLTVGIVRASRLQIHKKNMVFINICKTYWHFLGILWILLLLFLYFA
ncbi:MAG: cytochrome c oxidase subunit 3 [bacterium]|nr:cytochrome c oxidase subunit 3 [bacterium]